MRTYPATTHTLSELAHASLAVGREPFTVPAAADKTGTLAAFATALGFPDWFGGNLDALNDCLGDWADALSSPSALLWQRSATLDAGTAAAVESILGEAEAGSPHLAVVVLG